MTHCYPTRLGTKPWSVLAFILASGCLAVLALPQVPALAAGGQADLQVSVADDVDPVAVGDPLNYTVSVTNPEPAGGDTATGVALDDVIVDKPGQALPLGSPLNLTPTQGAAIVGVTTTQGTCARVPVVIAPSPLQPREYGERVQCNLGDIPPNTTIRVTIEVSARLNTFLVLQPAGVIADVARATSGNDPSATNNVAVQSTTVTQSIL